MITTEGTVDPAGIACLNSLIGDGWCRSALYVQETASTNSLAIDHINRDAAEGPPLPRLFLTDSQSAGRGRMGRSWASSQDSLTFSILLDTRTIPAIPSLPLSIWVGVLVAEALDPIVVPSSVDLKWPNDLYLGGRKVGGVLVEATQKHPHLAVVGIGVNVRSAPAPAAHDPSFTATALADLVTGEVDRFDVLDQIVRQLGSSTDDASPASILERFRNKCWLTGQRVSLHQFGQRLEGVCRGIDASGQLLIEDQERLVSVHSGEATLVRRDARQ